jgi:hypothetical protein
MAFQWPRGAIMEFDGTPVSDHSRSPVSISVERIENSVRMANGTRRHYHIADKHSFSVSWELLPTEDEKTVDGYMGAESLRAFYLDNTGPFTLTVRGRPVPDPDPEAPEGATVQPVETFIVVFDSFGAEIVKRWEGRDLWNVNIELEEV